MCEHALEHVSQSTHLRGNMVVGIKDRKLCDKMHIVRSSYVKICTQMCPCKSKSCIEARLFYTEHVSHAVASVSILRHGFV